MEGMSFSALIATIAEGQVFVTEQIDGKARLYFENGHSVSMSISEAEQVIEELGYLQELMSAIEALRDDPYQ